MCVCDAENLLLVSLFESVRLLCASAGGDGSETLALLLRSGGGSSLPSCVQESTLHLLAASEWVDVHERLSLSLLAVVFDVHESSTVKCMLAYT